MTPLDHRQSRPAAGVEAADPRDWSQIEPHYAALLAEALTPEGVSGWVRRWSDARKVVWEGWSGVKAVQEHDLTDEAAQRALQRFIDEVLTPSEVADAALAAKLLAVDGWAPDAEQAHLLRRLRATAASISAATVALDAEIGAVARRYEAIGPTLTFTIDGAAVEKPDLDRRLRARERDVREAAWRAQAAAWLGRRAEIDAVFRELLDGRRRLARAAGLPDYRAFRWLQTWRFDYSPDDCRAFHEAVAAEVTPAAARRWEARRAALGAATLRPWDLLADPAAREPAPAFGDTAAFTDGMAPVLAAVDPELGALFGRMRAAGCLDLGWSPGKRGGGVERPFPRSGLPFVRVGVDGTESGVGTLLHEMGHAWHDHLTMANQELVWSLEHPDEFSEVAAFALYLLAAPALGRPGVGPWPAATAERALAALLEEVLLDWLPTFALTDAFQHWAYAEAPAEVGADEVDAVWSALTARFTPWVDWSGLEAERGAGWQRAWSPFLQPFYDLTYALAMVGALGVWRAAQADWTAAWRRYRAALALGATRPLPELYAAAGAGWPFERAALRETVALLEAAVARWR
jgi:oligoendopeptidase F